MKVWTLLLLAGAAVVHAAEKEKVEKKSEAEPESAAAADEGKGKRAWINPYMGAGFPALHPAGPFAQPSHFVPGHPNYPVAASAAEALYTRPFPYFSQHQGFDPRYQHGYYTDVFDPRFSQRVRPWMRPFGYFGTGNINLARYYGLRQAGAGAGQRFNQGFGQNLRPDATVPDQSASSFFPQFSTRPNVIDTAAPGPGIGRPDVIDMAGQRFGPDVIDTAGQRFGPDVIDTAGQRFGPDVIDTAGQRFGPDVIDTAGQRFGPDVIDTAGQRFGPDVIDTAGQRFGPDVIDTSGQRFGPDVIDTAGQRFGPDVIDTAGQRFGPDVIDTAAPELNPQFTPGQFQPPSPMGGRVFGQGGASFQGGSAPADRAPNQFQPGPVGGEFGAGGGAGPNQATGLQSGPFQPGQAGDSFGAGQFGGSGIPLPTGAPTPAGPAGSPAPGGSPAGFGGPPPPGFDVSVQSGPPYDGQPLGPIPTSPPLGSTSGPDVIDTGANPTLAPSASGQFFNTVGAPGSLPFGGGGLEGPEPDIIDRARVSDWSNIPVSLPRVGFESVDDGQNSDSTGVFPASTKGGAVAIFTSDPKTNKPLSPPSSGKPTSPTPAGTTHRQDLISSQSLPSGNDSSDSNMRTSATKRKVLDKTNALKSSN